MSELLQVRNLQVRLPMGGDREFAVKDATFSLEAGKTRCIIGESGSGKSLTSQAIMGLLPRRFPKPGGEILLNGRNLLALPETQMRALRGGSIGMVFQEPMTALNPLWRVAVQIEEALILHTNMNRSQRRQKVESLLREVHLDPDIFARRYPHELSGGQRQRVVIAMALACEPQLLIADEPTTALDVTTQAQILSLIKELQTAHNTGVLFITHDFGVVADIADDVTVMKDGLVVESGSVSDVLSNPREDYTRALLDAVPQGLTNSRDMADRKVVLNVRNLTKSYRQRRQRLRRAVKVKAVNDVTFEVREGEIVGIVGESGSGKSTVAKCVSRLLAADAGTIDVSGAGITKLRGEQLRQSRRHVQMVFQDPFSSLNPRRRIGYIVGQGPMNFGTPAKEALAAAGKLLQTVGLGSDSVMRFPSDFSGGQRQRVGLARALALDPKVLIADEAVSALDVTIQAQVLELLRSVRDELGVAILFITHDLRVAAELCDRVLVMQSGSVVESGTPEQIFHNPTNAYTQKLISSLPGKAFSAKGDTEQGARTATANS